MFSDGHGEETRRIGLHLDAVGVVAVKAGSAQISSRVRSGPSPASGERDRDVEVAGKPFAASRADPSKIFSGSAMLSIRMLFSTDRGAPTSPWYRLAGDMRTEWIVPLRRRGHLVQSDHRPVGTTI